MVVFYAINSSSVKTNIFSSVITPLVEVLATEVAKCEKYNNTTRYNTVQEMFTYYNKDDISNVKTEVIFLCK